MTEEKNGDIVVKSFTNVNNLLHWYHGQKIPETSMVKNQAALTNEDYPEADAEANGLNKCDLLVTS